MRALDTLYSQNKHCLMSQVRVTYQVSAFNPACRDSSHYLWHATVFTHLLSGAGTPGTQTLRHPDLAMADVQVSGGGSCLARYV